MTRLPQTVRPRAVLMGTLAAALLLRLALVQLGGQLYWSDEHRYVAARIAVAELAAGKYRQALGHFDAGNHPLFRVVGLGPAAVEYLAGVKDTRIPAAFFGLFSVLNIWLIGGIARRLGAGDWEAALASAVAAMSNVLTYWARHLVPYDVSMTLGLASLLVGTAPRRAHTSILCGFLSACGFLTYSGYWTLAFAAIVIHAAAGSTPREAARRGLLASSGMVATLAAAIAGNAALGGHLLARLVAFSQTARQGLFSEGWSLPIEYFWEAEHLVLVSWLIALAWSTWRGFKGAASARERVGLIGVTVIYGSLVLTSVVLHKFVVYGRLARQLVPLLCLLTANRLEALRTARSPTARAAFGCALPVLVVQALVSFSGPLHQSFPLDFTRDDSPRGNWGIRRRYGTVVAVNATNTHPFPDPVKVPPRYLTLKEAPHPREYRPYQYEGCTPAQRAAVRSRDMRMRLVLPLPDQKP